MIPIWKSLPISLTNRPKNFVKELEKLLNRHSVNGVMAEYCQPDLSSYTETPRKIWRATQANPTNACAYLRNLRIEEDVAWLDVVLWGPRRDFLEMEENRGVVHGIALRLIKGASGNIRSIASLDLAPLDQFDEPQVLEVETLL